MTNRSARRSTRPLPAVTALLVALALVAAACGSDDDDSAGGDPTTTSEAGDTTSTDGADEGDTAAGDESDGAGTTEEADDDTDDSDTNDSATDGDTGDSDTGAELPGEPWDGFTADGDVLAVVGVAYDDELNVRSIPGTEGEIVATAGPTADDLVATGRARSLPESLWYEVSIGGETGWVSTRFVAFQGVTDDATAEFLDGGPPVEAETMVDLAQPIIDFYASEEPPSNVAQSVAASVGDLGEITYDVIGIGDDSIAGYRLHIFGMPTASGEGFVLDSIERTTFCSRGSSGDFCA